jgi:drug/metabolite transporter (DMT)-like permease
LGIVAVSFGSIFVRMAAAPSLAVATYRMTWATLLLTPFAMRGALPELRKLRRAEWGRLLLSGAALALHFALWIASLSYTSVASSVLLVDTTPFFIGLATWSVGKGYPRAFWTGLSAAFLGCIIVFQSDWSASADSATGNGLAVGGAIAVAAYLMIGGAARQKLSLTAYVWPVYGTAAAVLWAACAAAGITLRGYSGSTHLFMFLLGLVPQCIGHTTYNWSLRWLPAGIVAVVGLAEPVVAGFLAWIALGEQVTGWKVIGGLVILAGIYLASRPARLGRGVPDRYK